MGFKSGSSRHVCRAGVPDQKPQELPPCAMYRFTDPLPLPYCTKFETVILVLTCPQTRHCRAEQQRQM